MVKSLAYNVGDMGSIPALGRTSGETAIHSSILAWKIPWAEEHGMLQSMGVAKSQTRLSNFTSLQKEYLLLSSVFLLPFKSKSPVLAHLLIFKTNQIFRFSEKYDFWAMG